MDGFFEAAAVLDERNAPQDGRVAVLNPRQYYGLISSVDTNILNREVGTTTEGSLNSGKGLVSIAGIRIFKSNNLPFMAAYNTAVTGENNTYHANYTDSVGLVFNKQAVGTVKLMDLKMEQTGSDVHALWQGTFMVGSMMHGTGVLRPDCAIEVYWATS